MAPSDHLAGLPVGRSSARPLELGAIAVAHRSFGVTGAGTATIGAGPADVVDVVDTPYGSRALIGTVDGPVTTGRATAAALVTAFRACARAAALEDAAVALDASVSQTGDDAVSAAVLLIEHRPQGEVTVVNCGHPDPLLLFAGGGPIPLPTTRDTAALGRRPQPVGDEYHVRPGEAVFCFTGGVVQARGGNGAVFDVITRCRGAVADVLDATAVVDCVFSDLFVHFGGMVEHDASLLLLQRLR